MDTISKTCCRSYTSWADIEKYITLLERMFIYKVKNYNFTNLLDIFMNTYLLTKTGIIYIIVGEDSANEIYYVTMKGLNMQYEIHHNNVFLIDSNLSYINEKKRIHFKG